MNRTLHYILFSMLVYGQLGFAAYKIDKTDDAANLSDVSKVEKLSISELQRMQEIGRLTNPTDKQLAEFEELNRRLQLSKSSKPSSSSLSSSLQKTSNQQNAQGAEKASSSTAGEDLVGKLKELGGEKRQATTKDIKKVIKAEDIKPEEVPDVLKQIAQTQLELKGMKTQHAEKLIHELDKAQSILLNKNMTGKQKAQAIGGLALGGLVTIGGSIAATYLVDRFNAWTSGDAIENSLLTDPTITDSNDDLSTTTTAETEAVQNGEPERIELDVDMSKLVAPSLEDLRMQIAKVSSAPDSVLATSSQFLTVTTEAIIENIKIVFEDALTLTTNENPFDAETVSDQIVNDTNMYVEQITPFIVNINNLIADTATPAVTVPELLKTMVNVISQLEDSFNDVMSVQFVKAVFPLQKKITKSVVSKVMKTISDVIVAELAKAQKKLERGYQQAMP